MSPSSLFVAELPPHWETLLGYAPPPGGRWMWVYWSCHDQNPMYEDGVQRVAGDVIVYLNLLNDPHFHESLLTTIQQHLHPFWTTDILGTSVAEATHCLLCDLKTRQIYVSELLRAQR